MITPEVPMFRICCLIYILFLTSACTPAAASTTAPSNPYTHQVEQSLAVADYAGAVRLLAPRAADDPDAAAQLSRVRLEWGLALLVADKQSPAALRSAYNQFAWGAAIAPEDTDIRNQLETYRQEAADLFALAQMTQALRTGTEQPDDPTLAASARALHAAADQLADSDLPGAAEQITAARAVAAAILEQTPAESAPAAVQPAVAATATHQPTPTPDRPAAVPGFGVTRRVSFEGSGDSGAFAACIDVQVIGVTGPVAGAVVGINNGDLHYQNQTNAAGYTGRCGLGASTWTVVLFWVPGHEALAGAQTTVYLNGAEEQRGEVVFEVNDTAQAIP
jgi:hypothetical protein